MERRVRFLWWGLLVVLIIIAIWRLFLPHGNKAYLEKTSASREIVVYVTGAVSKPGLVHLPLNARLDDALKEVNLLPEANVEALNPAEKLKDGQKISVPYKPIVTVPPAPIGLAGGTAPGSLPAGGGSGVTAGTTSAAGSPAVGGSTATAGTGATGTTVGTASSGGKININTAGVAELDKLPGIGPALAERIIKYRTDNGPFVRPEDLQEVAGIGPKTYEKMASMVSVGP